MAPIWKRAKTIAICILRGIYTMLQKRFSHTDMEKADKYETGYMHAKKNSEQLLSILREMEHATVEVVYPRPRGRARLGCTWNSLTGKWELVQPSNL